MTGEDGTAPTVSSTPAARPRSPTINDVALKAGVAASTVSRALSVPGRVKPSTREHIERVARELNYVPNTHARALISGRTGAVAVLVSDITNPFYFDIIRGTQQQLKAAGYTQLLVDTEESGELEVGTLAKLQRSCDGAILTAPRLSDVELAALAKDMPIVAINRASKGVPSVMIDTAGGMNQALEHLASLGHTRVLYIAGPRSSWSNEKRWRAMRAAAERLGVQTGRTAPFVPKTSSGAAAADALLNSGATACVAFNDLLAIGMLERLRERNIRVPRDISIVGCDDIFGADFCNPPLTTLAAPIEEAGRVAVSMLLSLFAPANARVQRRSVVLPTYLTVRASTGPAPAS
ncbi:LacI family DNA-binding transcriptional regulator [Pengzhenrongella sp.]|uniref:LacI family DNA-binding transcriptional regulator n=1 Tax=Pengzhenrongella sp. TaxID=2888820 RepID=UPI002F923D4E